MQPIYYTRRSRAAISGQTELHPLQLGDSAANMSANVSTNLNNNTNTNTPPRGTGLTDAEMMEAEAGWDLRDRNVRGDSYHMRHLNNPARFTRIERTQNLLTRPINFGIVQQDGTTAQIFQGGRAGLLLNAEEGRNLRGSMERKQLSRPYFWACAITPVTAIAFGLGFFDWIMVEKTDGRIREMDRDDKWQALALLAPISLMVWVIIIVLVFLAVVAAKGGL